MNSIESTGWFYLYRGNGYGPFETEEIAEEKSSERYSKDTWKFKSRCKISFRYGTANVLNRSLIKFVETMN